MSDRTLEERFRKKPVEITAWRWTGASSLDDAPEFVREWYCRTPSNKFRERCKVELDPWGTDWLLYIPTLEGIHLASPGDWIVRGVKGELYPVKPDIFEETYERV